MMKGIPSVKPTSSHSSATASPSRLRRSLSVRLAGPVESAMRLRISRFVLVAVLAAAVLVLLRNSGGAFCRPDVRSSERLASSVRQLHALRRQNQRLRQVADRCARIARSQQLCRQKKEGKTEKINQKENNIIIGHKYENVLKRNNKGKGDYDSRKGGAALTRHVNDSRLKPPSYSTESTLPGPGLRHERMRRRVVDGITELWRYVTSQLQQLPGGATAGRVKNVLLEGKEHVLSVMADLTAFSNDSSTVKWRESEATALSQIVQSRLRWLQNPVDCAKAKKLVCNLNKGCGFGCQIHHLLYCLTVAYGTERTLILESAGWRYAEGGWETMFLPLSDTCRTYSEPSGSWGDPESIENVTTVELPIIDSLQPRPEWLPQSVPRDLAGRLQRIHGSPIVWWLGQLVKYLLRPQPHLERLMKATARRIGFQRPIVGIHVRRTDKIGTEASYHALGEYMQHVDDYYAFREKLSANALNVRRRVFLATDDPELLAEARNNYPGYVFVSDNSFSRMANLASRYSDSSLRGIVLDIHLLSMSDFLVCTFSSQVCRLAYEIMQSLHPDASGQFHSLDDIYYFGGQNLHNQRVVWPHKARHDGQLDLKVGDEVGVAGNHWNGISQGTNRRTGKSGLFPSYKVADEIQLANFPTYPHVKVATTRV